MYKAPYLAQKYKDKQDTFFDLKKPTVFHILSHDPRLDVNFLRTGLHVLYPQNLYSFIS